MTIPSKPSIVFPMTDELLADIRAGSTIGFGPLDYDDDDDARTPYGRFVDALAVARTQDHTGEAADWDEAMGGATLDELLYLIAQARTQKRLADLIRAAAKLRAAAALGKGNAVSDGQTLYRYTSPIIRTVKDGAGLLEWLGPFVGAVVLNLDDAVSIERFRQVAESRASENGHPDPKAYAAEKEAEFFAVSWGDPDLSEMPLSHRKAPKYAAEMTPGEIRKGRA